MKKIKIFSSLILTAAILAACGSASTEGTSPAETNIIRLGTTPGPYSELFLEEVAPILEDQGYSIEPISFQDPVAQNTAMDEGQVDLNVDQHTAYLQNFNEEAGTDLQAMGPTPSLASGLYPARKSSIEEVEEGDLVALPEDAVNFARGLTILEDIGWIEVEDGVSLLELSEDHITENHAGIDIQAIPSPSIPPAALDLDYMVLPGAVVYDAGLDFDEVLARENLIDKLYLQVVVPAQHQDDEWVQDVVDIYESDAFKERVAQISQDPDQPNWQIPES